MIIFPAPCFYPCLLNHCPKTEQLPQPRHLQLPCHWRLSAPDREALRVTLTAQIFYSLWLQVANFTLLLYISLGIISPGKHLTGTSLVICISGTPLAIAIPLHHLIYFLSSLQCKSSFSLYYINLYSFHCSGKWLEHGWQAIKMEQNRKGNNKFLGFGSCDQKSIMHALEPYVSVSLTSDTLIHSFKIYLVLPQNGCPKGSKTRNG